MPKKSSTAKQRARAAARNGAKYTAARRANSSQGPADATARATYVNVSAANMATAMGAGSYIAETLRRQQPMFDSYAAKMLADAVNTSGIVETLAKQQAAMGSMLAKTVADMVSASGLTETLAKQQAMLNSYMTTTFTNIGRTASSQIVAAVQQAALAHARATETGDAVDRAASLPEISTAEWTR